MFKTLREAFKMPDVRKKILITLFLLLVYRIGCFVPIPGIEAGVFKSGIDSSGARDFLNLMSSLAGGALSKGAILALGVSPYITSSIVMQLMTIAIPSLERLSKQGDEGRRKIAVITRYVALFMALIQAIAIVVSFGTGGIRGDLFGQVPSFVISMIVILVLTAGSMFTVWIGDKITEHGVSNGMSMLIFVGILSTGVGAFYNSLGQVFGFAGHTANIGQLYVPIVFALVLFLIFFGIVFVDLGERRIPVTYAKQVKGNKMYGGQSANIPIKINATGVIPIIFAFSIINFPQLIMSIFWPGQPADIWYANNVGTGTWLNIVLTALLILGFTYFYATLSFNPEDVSRQIQQNGGFILGYRPGKPTTDYLKKVSNRITLFGAIFLMIIALIPSLIFAQAFGDDVGSLLNAFTSIGLLISVSVALEFDKQLQGYMLMKTYKGFLK
jgi:preprotein translocase subunit SecY